MEAHAAASAVYGDPVLRVGQSNGFCFKLWLEEEVNSAGLNQICMGNRDGMHRDVEFARPEVQKFPQFGKVRI